MSGNLNASGARPGDAHAIERLVVEDFDAVFREHHRPVYRFLARRVGPDLGEQLASEVFLTAYRRRHDFVAVHASPLPWLYGIASGLLANHRRKETRHLRACSRANTDATASSDPFDVVDGQLDAARLWPELASRLHAMSAGDRDALLLLAWTDMSYEQIADALGVPIGTVRSRIHRARSQLQGSTTS